MSFLLIELAWCCWEFLYYETCVSDSHRDLSLCYFLVVLVLGLSCYNAATLGPDSVTL